MEPGFHLLYARRLAWRHRFLLALGLALLGFLHPPLALASPLPLLLPAQLWERRALKEITRISLAYPTALAYGDERLWAEAKRVRIPLPPFPTGLLLVYLFALLLVLVLAAWRSPSSPESPWRLSDGERPVAREQAPSPSEDGETGQEEPSPGKAVRDPAEAPTSEEGQPSAAGPSPSREDPGSRERGTPYPQAQEGQAPTGGQTPSPGQAGGSPGQAEGPGSAQATSPSQEGLEETGSRGPGTSGPDPQVASPAPSPPLEPEGKGEGLLPPGEAGTTSLPSPWGQGQPPEAVRRGVEVYLERTPLPPEARELLRRYFSGP